MEYAIRLVATSWLDIDTIGTQFHESLDGTLVQRDDEWLVTVYQRATTPS